MKTTTFQRSVANHLTISPFVDDCAGEITGWPAGNDEAMAWAGRGAMFPVPPEQLLRWNTDPDVHGFVGYQQDKLVAYGERWVDPDEQEIEIARVIVHPAHRGIGIGRLFVKSLVAQATNFGFSKSVLRVLPANSRAIRCYEAAGFVKMSSEELEIFNRQQPYKYVWLRYVE